MSFEQPYTLPPPRSGRRRVVLDHGVVLHPNQKATNRAVARSRRRRFWAHNRTRWHVALLVAGTAVVLADLGKWVGHS